MAYFRTAFTDTLKLTPEDQSTTPLAQLLLPHFTAVRLFDRKLGIYDKGFYKGPALQDLAQRGGYFLIPHPHSVSVWQTTPQDHRHLLDLNFERKSALGPLVQWSNLWLGQTASQLGPVRLVAFRLAEENANRRRDALRKKCRAYGRTPTAQALVLAGWLILVTNAPPEKLPAQAVGYLYRVRWQIELVFKQLKSIFRLEILPSQNGSRVQCEIWARLLCALLLFVFHQHANTLCWAQHQREISFAKLAKLLRQLGYTLARACFLGPDPLTQILNELWRKILKHTRKEHQNTRKTTWQNLCDHWLLPCSSEPVSVGS